MKMFKRFAAALLVGVMALAMLTACGKEAIVRDTEQEKTAVTLTQTAAKTKLNVDLKEDETVTGIAATGLPAAVDMYNAAMKKDKEAFAAAAKDMATTVQEKIAAAGKKGVIICDVVPGELTKEIMEVEFKALQAQVQAGTIKMDFAPTKVGAAVTKKGDYTVFVIVVTNE